MKIHIEIDTLVEDAATLSALFAALAGRAPAVMAPFAEAPAPRGPSGIPHERTATSISPTEAAERLMRHAEATRAAPPPPADEGDEIDGTEDVNLPTLDSSGVPWDSRIHSSPPKINKTGGQWRAKRGVSEVEFGRVHAELQHAVLAAGGAPNAPAVTGIANTGTASPPADIVTPPPAPPPPADMPPVASGDVPPLAARPAPPPPPAAPIDGASANTAATSTNAAVASVGSSRFDTFASFVEAVSKIRSPAIPYDELCATATDVGVAGGFKDMRLHPDKWELFYGMVGGQ